MPRKPSQYQTIISEIFRRNYPGSGQEFTFHRDEIEDVGVELGVGKPKNLGDVIYAYRHRRALPQDILRTQPEGHHWIILGAGDAQYRFKLSKLLYLVPTQGLMQRKIPDSTPEIVSRYAQNDEQALLAKIRYNRLVDIFLGLTASPLQSHLRTKIPNYGQIEIDEMYVGVDSRGAQFIIPVQAKGGSDKLGVIQTIQDLVYCRSNPKYQGTPSRAVSAQFLDGDTIAMFELDFDGDEVCIVAEQHYRLSKIADISQADLDAYNSAAFHR
ncbi:MAG: endonuclease [Pseudomonadota bacterium]